MKNSKTLLFAGAALLAALPATASAQKVQSGSANGLNWKAKSHIVGQTSTATIVGGGNPIYLADRQRYSGTVALIMEYDDGSAFICSGSLLNNRRSILTAAHCVSGGAGTANPTKTTAYFYGGPVTDNFFNAAGSVAVNVREYHVNDGYTGEVIDQNDIAVLSLSQYAPEFARSYDLFTAGDLTGYDYNVAGYGARSDTGGAVGDNLGTGRLRQGDNTYDFRLGDDAFGDFFTKPDETGERFFGTADVEYSYISDFDNGRRANDGSCLLSTLGLGTDRRFCDTGLGRTEVSIAGGDSGGPGFIGGKIASVNSYGLSFGSDFGDIDDDLNSTWGEFNGFVPTFIHTDFIRGATVPEPATWALMILGFGAVGGSMRRRGRVDVRFAAA